MRRPRRGVAVMTSGTPPVTPVPPTSRSGPRGRTAGGGQRGFGSPGGEPPVRVVPAAPRGDSGGLPAPDTPRARAAPALRGPHPVAAPCPRTSPPPVDFVRDHGRNPPAPHQGAAGRSRVDLTYPRWARRATAVGTPVRARADAAHAPRLRMDAAGTPARRGPRFRTPRSRPAPADMIVTPPSPRPPYRRPTRGSRPVPRSG